MAVPASLAAAWDEALDALAPDPELEALAAQARDEIAAENAWLRAAEYDEEAQRDLDRDRFPFG